MGINDVCPTKLFVELYPTGLLVTPGLESLPLYNTLPQGTDVVVIVAMLVVVEGI